MATQLLRTEAGVLAEGRVNKREAAVLTFATQMATVIWDFSIDGGAVGTLSFGTALPVNAVVTRVFRDEQTAVTGATDIKIQAGSTDLTASTDFTAVSGVGTMTLASSATAIKPSTSSSSELKMVITTNAATAGKVRFGVEFYISK